MATVKKFNLVCILETDSNELEKNLKFLDSFKGLKTALNDGISSILLKTGKDKINLLSSILGFSETLLSNPDFIQKDIEIKRSFHKIFKIIKVENPALEEDTMTEIRFTALPKEFIQVSNYLRALVITSNLKTAQFCETIKLDYFLFENESDFLCNKNYIENLYNENGYDLVIYEFKQSNLELLKIYNKVVFEEIDPFKISHYFLLSPYFEAKDAIQWENNSFGSEIRPKQTWEYLNGNLNNEFENLDQCEAVFSFFYEIEGCRKDKIENFEMIAEKKNFKFIGNKISNARLFIREVAFKIGKLPKFGA